MINDQSYKFFIYNLVKMHILNNTMKILGSKKQKL
jgi:hypothetical protein